MDNPSLHLRAVTAAGLTWGVNLQASRTLQASTESFLASKLHNIGPGTELNLWKVPSDDYPNVINYERK